MGHAQLVAALGAATLEDVATIIGAHPLAEAVCLHFVPYIRLIRSLHLISPQKLHHIDRRL